MARHLYTIAVVAPAMQLALNDLLTGPHRGIESAERQILAAAGSDQPLVAFFRMLLDGWDRAHASLPAPISTELDQVGWVWITDPVIVPEAASTPALNDRSRAALHDALRDALAFVEATGCAAIILWRTVHASFDDREFGAGGMRPRYA